MRGFHFRFVGSASETPTIALPMIHQMTIPTCEAFGVAVVIVALAVVGVAVLLIDAVCALTIVCAATLDGRDRREFRRNTERDILRLQRASRTPAVPTSSADVARRASQLTD